VPRVRPVSVSRSSSPPSARDPEVGHQRLPVRQQDVLRLDVPVDRAVPVGIVERQRRLAGDAHRVGDGQLALAPEPVAQALAFDVRHGEPQATRRLARVEHGKDVGVLQAGGELDLAQEPLGAEAGRHLGVEHLEGHRAVVPQVAGEVDRGHAPTPELTLERVALGQPLPQIRRRVSHGGAPLWKRW
jgi:hypothetical protein